MKILSSRRLLASVVAFGSVALVACGERGESDMAVTQQTIDWASITQKRVLFAHQSVGSNVLSGVERLAKSNGAQIGIYDQRSGPLAAGITHFKVGKNGDPKSKISEFSEVLDTAGGLDADVALMKLCYIDFNADTDARQVAEAYSGNIDSLARKYPNTTFVAVTTPLTAVQTGPKAWAKRLMGRLPGQYAENAKRAEFNALIRDRYGAQGRVFDLARVESEAAGRRTVVTVDGRQVEALDPTLTYDGGHLNDRGQDVVATAFLSYLSSLTAR